MHMSYRPGHCMIAPSLVHQVQRDVLAVLQPEVHTQILSTHVRNEGQANAGALPICLTALMFTSSVSPSITRAGPSRI